MSWTPHPSEMPSSEHLRDDINLPEEPAEEGAAEFSEDAFTSTALNAGQHVPGLSPDGEYREGFDPEHEEPRTPRSEES